jgi:hypothetical protein
MILLYCRHIWMITHLVISTIDEIRVVDGWIII